MENRTGRSWNEEDTFWRDNYSSRPYSSEGRDYEHYRPAYRYGTESASRHQGRDWNDAEPELREGWEGYEHRGSNQSTWDEIKQAAKDAWDRVTGEEGDGSRGREHHHPGRESNREDPRGT